MSQKPIKVLESVDGDSQVSRIYVQLNDERTKFMLYVVSSAPMNDERIMDLVAQFVESDGLPVMSSEISEKH